MEKPKEFSWEKCICGSYKDTLKCCAQQWAVHAQDGCDACAELLLAWHENRPPVLIMDNLKTGKKNMVEYTDADAANGYILTTTETVQESKQCI